MAVATDSASVNVRALEDLMREGARALIDRLGYANAARFIAILGGEDKETQYFRMVVFEDVPDGQKIA